MFISDGHYVWQEGDNKAAIIYPPLADHGQNPDLEGIQLMPGESWSNHGDVTWNLVS